MSPFFLLLPVMLPIIGGIAVYFIPSSRTVVRNTAVLCCALLTSVSIWLLLLNSPSEPFRMLELVNGMKLELSLDGPGGFYLGLISVLWLVAVVYSFGYMKDEKHLPMYYSFYIAAYGVTSGIALSGNLLTLFFFYEMLTLVTLPLVIQPMTKIAKRATRKYMYFSVAGSAFAFFGLVCMAVCGGTTEFVAGGAFDGAIYAKYGDLLDVVYVITSFGFGVKAVIFPLCAWLPSATVAPTPTTALLHAVAVVKSGAFAVMRLTDYCYNPEYLRGTWMQSVMLCAVLVTILYGSSMALRETHFKRRLAYSTVANISYILFGVLFMTRAGLIAALLHFLFHSLIKTGAFFCAGNMIKASGREYVTQLRGLGRRLPVSSALFALCGLSLMGLPLFGGFVSKWHLCLAAAESEGFFGVAGIAVLLISAMLTAIYMLSVAIRLFMPATPVDSVSYADVHEPRKSMIVCALIPSVLGCFGGFFGKSIISLVEIAVEGVFI